MDIQKIPSANLMPELAQSLDERLTFDIAYCTALQHGEQICLDTAHAYTNHIYQFNLYKDPSVRVQSEGGLL